MKIEKEKIIKKILVGCIYTIIILGILYNIIFSISTTMFESDYLKIFGISLFNMKSDLMENDIKSGDIVIIKEQKLKELKEGDIIAYTINGKTRINKIFKKQQNEYVTKSNKNYNPDIEKIKNEQIIGKMEKRIPFFGFIIEIMQSKITTAILLIVFATYYIYNRYLQKKKQERAIKKKNTI